MRHFYMWFSVLCDWKEVPFHYCNKFSLKCGICGSHCDTRKGFSPRRLMFLLSTLPQVLRIHFYSSIIDAVLSWRLTASLNENVLTAIKSSKWQTSSALIRNIACFNMATVVLVSNACGRTDNATKGVPRVSTLRSKTRRLLYTKQLCWPHSQPSAQ